MELTLKAILIMIEYYTDKRGKLKGFAQMRLEQFTRYLLAYFAYFKVELFDSNNIKDEQ